MGLLISAGLVALNVESVRHAGPLWRDEVNGVNLATMPSLAQVWANHHLDSFPVVWATLLHVWSVAVGNTDAALRGLGLAVGLATIAVVWSTGRRLGVGPPLATLVLFALSPSTIVYGDWVRGYGLGALVLVWFIGASWSFVRSPGRWAFCLALTAAVTAVQTYLPNGVLVMAVLSGAAAVCLRRNDRRLLGAVVLLGALTTASLAIDLGWIRYAFTIAPIEQSTWSFDWLISVFLGALAPGVPLLASAWAAASALAVVGLGRMLFLPAADEPEADKDLALFCGVAASAAIIGYFIYLEYIAKLHSQYWYYLSLMALLALVCDVGIQMLTRRLRFGETVRVAAFALIALLAARDVATATRVRMTNIDAAAATIVAEAHPEDLVVVLPWYCGITFERYYRGPAPWVTLPNFAEHRFHTHNLVAERMALGDAGIRPELDAMEQALRHGGRVWIVGEPKFPPPGQPAPSLPAAPTGPLGWHVGPYLEGWAFQLGAFLREHARDVWTIPVSEKLGPVNWHEDLPLFLVEGWK